MHHANGVLVFVDSLPPPNDQPARTVHFWHNAVVARRMPNCCKAVHYPSGQDFIYTNINDRLDPERFGTSNHVGSLHEFEFIPLRNANGTVPKYSIGDSGVLNKEITEEQAFWLRDLCAKKPDLVMPEIVGRPDLAVKPDQTTQDTPARLDERLIAGMRRLRKAKKEHNL